jgi:phage replication initiation protein
MSQIFTPIYDDNGQLSDAKKIFEVVSPTVKKLLPFFEADVPYMEPRKVTKSVEEKLVIEGGKVKIATEGRQIDMKDQGGVICDYLRFTVLRDRLPGFKTRLMPEDSSDEDIARWLAVQFSGLLGYAFGVQRNGRDYYEHTFTIENAFGHEVASVSGGGDSQRDTFCFTLKGEGCTFALPGWEQRVSEFFEPMFPKITRIDLARDCFDHGQLCIEAAVTAYKDHAFSYRARRPKHCEFGSWLPDEEFGGVHSRTFQIGKRESGKLIRIYEKGHQFGMMDSQWVRAEVELRSVNRVIPWEALTKTGDFFAGAYEFCNWLVHHLDKCPTPVKTQSAVAVISVEKVMKWVNRVVALVLVQITSVMPDFDWMETIVLSNMHRPIPRGLRGLNHTALDHGLKAFFNRINPDQYIDHGLASPA